MKGILLASGVLLWILMIVAMAWMLPFVSIVLLGVGLALFIPAVARRRRRI